MKRNFRPALLLVAAGLSASLASAQIQLIAEETFDYGPYPADFNGQAGGTGFANPWFVTNISDMRAYDNAAAMTPFNLAGPNEGFASVDVRDGSCYRVVDVAPHIDVTTNVNGVDVFGADGAVIWVSFKAVRYAGTMTQGEHYGGFRIIQQGCCEEMFIGSPWDTNEWGIDDSGPGGAPPVTIAGTDNRTETQIVVRFDHAAGDDRMRMWLNPSTPYPTGPADLDQTVHDFYWQEISFGAGGNGGQLFYFDDLRIEKGEPLGITPGICGPANANSTGNPATIDATGSNLVAMDNVTLNADSLPNNAFGFFLTSETQALVMMPGGSQGNLCLGGAIGRYVGPGQIRNSGTTGSFDLVLDLTQTPTPTGLISVMPGTTRFYQAWFRDSVGGAATSNFTDAVQIDFM